ncbi:MAG: hypothetical protein IJ672_09360, partial [Methanobrevibacter sp.]|nr:hypothetical protein [Methanobrevibacter sp.]
MNFKKTGFILFFLFILILCVGAVSANEIDDTNITQADNTHGYNLENSDVDSSLEATRIVTVKNWEELQYYASLSDKNYVVQLKENTNYY